MNCTPKKPLRCWQHKAKDTSPVPRWVANALTFGEPVALDQPNYVWNFEDGDWLVEFDQGAEEADPKLSRDAVFGAYTNGQFTAMFVTVSAPALDAGNPPHRKRRGERS